jgi:protocatechuate 3,4-dioxygenase alpha subunit
MEKGAVPVSGPNELQAPHILIAVFARGMTRQAHTRIYFEGEAGNATDPILALVPAERRATLIASREPADTVTYRFDIRLQGDRETVFFDL